MRYLLFLVVLGCPLLAEEEPKLHHPLPIKVRATVTEAATQEAAALLKELPTVPPADATDRLSALLKDSNLPRDTAVPWFDLIAQVGGPTELQQLYVGL